MFGVLERVDREEREVKKVGEVREKGDTIRGVVGLE
jgi:hypothetical protein